MNNQNDNLDTAVIEVLLAHFKTVREEIRARMEMRQAAFVLYLGFVGAIFGLAANADNRRVIPIVVPFVSFGVVWIIRDHELGLARQGEWLRNSYQTYLNSQPKLKDLPHWDSNDLRKQYSEHILHSRFWGYTIVQGGSGLASLIIYWFVVGSITRIISAIFILASFLLIYLTYRDRQKIESFTTQRGFISEK